MGTHHLDPHVSEPTPGPLALMGFGRYPSQHLTDWGEIVIRRATLAGAVLYAVILIHPGAAHAQSYFGDGGQDNFTGTDNPDYFETYGGADTVFAKDGNDEAHMGDGRDEVNGKWGADQIYGGDNPHSFPGEYLFGDKGNDDIFDSVGSDDDLVCPGLGGTGNYVDVYDGDGHDFIRAESGTNYSKDEGDFYTTGGECSWPL